MRHVPYVGNGPYCYANSFAMVMGERAPSTALIEVTTCGPFGMQVIAAAILREPAPTYEKLRAALSEPR